MSKTIEDMNKEMDDAIEQNHIEQGVSKADNLTLIKELHDRGVTIRDIFGRYYEFEEAGDGNTLTVADAELV